MQSFFDFRLHLIVLISVLCLSAGTIINNFYDQEKDKMIKPIRSNFEDKISKTFKLNFYILLNVIALLISISLSWRLFMYFFTYQFLLWAYSHRLNKTLLINNISYAWKFP